ncbi:O-methyltransferase involved in polyketide biosynthesis [Neisseria sp. HSC-16F19]|nr:class I SAM-dependent methyltransferase [Neisseria sp. HSC-16F19]MCP2041350.1 O-methyltransferase involved in polyketide biosynthesis [Neisseria sp. HSC-16F19]
MNPRLSPQTESALSDTLLIPLWAKAVEYGRADALLQDAEAARMLEAVDYDFSRFARARASQPGCCARAALIDETVQDFLSRHAQAVVVQLGAGLDARYERLGRPQNVIWYDLDLPPVITLRERLLPARGNHYLAASMLEEAWMHKVAAHGLPLLLVIEGVLMYFDEAVVRGFFANVARILPAAELVFDALPPLMVGKARHHDALGKLDEVPQFKWALADARTLQSWQPGLHVYRQTGLSSRCAHRYPLFLRLLYRTALGRRLLDPHIMHIGLTAPKAAD